MAVDPDEYAANAVPGTTLDATVFSYLGTEAAVNVFPRGERLPRTCDTPRIARVAAFAQALAHAQVARFPLCVLAYLACRRRRPSGMLSS